jgi:hypothetical protein
MGEQVFKGRTEDAEAPFLSSEFWKEGTRVVGVIERVFKIEGRNNYNLTLVKPVELDGEPYDRVSVGESAGLRMAMQAAKLHSLKEDDQIVLTCTGETPSKKAGNSPRKNFAIEVTRSHVEEDIPEYAR